MGEAQARYAQLDAAWDAARADARLRGHGIRRGVQCHVSNILAKLGLSSRVELAALIAGRAG